LVPSSGAPSAQMARTSAPKRLGVEVVIALLL
jgi:hypothetical protein